MRLITAIFLCFLLIFPAFADDTSKPFDEMTIAELKTVDIKALSKVDRKLHKDAMRVAKKAEKARKKEEKKRIAAEKKAEKARIKAEKKRARAEAKRLKAEAKALAKRNKKTLKRLAVIEEIYQKTSGTEDDFEGYISFISPRYPKPFLNIFDSRETRDYRMRAFFYPNKGQLNIQVRVSETIITDKINSETVSSLDSSPENYATRHGIWENYSRATARGGTQLDLVKLSRYWDSCEFSQCRFREDVGIKLNYQLLENSIRNLNNLEVKISGRRYYYIASIPPEFIAGFLKKMSEFVDANGKYAALALAIENGLKNQLATAPQ